MGTRKVEGKANECSYEAPLNMILFSLQESKFFLSSHHFFVAIAVNTQTALRQLLQILPLPRAMLPPKCRLVGWLSLFQRFFPIVALAILCCCRCHCMVAAVPYEDASAAQHCCYQPCIAVIVLVAFTIAAG